MTLSFIHRVSFTLSFIRILSIKDESSFLFFPSVRSSLGACQRPRRSATQATRHGVPRESARRMHEIKTAHHFSAGSPINLRPLLLFCFQPHTWAVFCLSTHFWESLTFPTSIHMIFPHYILYFFVFCGFTTLFPCFSKLL